MFLKNHLQTLIAGAGYSLIHAIQVCPAVKSMVFGQFSLEQF